MDLILFVKLVFNPFHTLFLRWHIQMSSNLEIQGFVAIYLATKLYWLMKVDSKCNTQRAYFTKKRSMRLIEPQKDRSNANETLETFLLTSSSCRLVA